MNILGINAYHGNASAALVRDGKLVAAVEEERFNRVKYAAGFPVAAIRYCLQEAGITLGRRGSRRRAAKSLGAAGHQALYALPCRDSRRERAKVLAQFVGIPRRWPGVRYRCAGTTRPVHRVEHHQAHLASTFFVSPFDQAACSPRRPGRFCQHHVGPGAGNRMQVHGACFPHSSGCSTRPSPNTWAFGNSATNTKSWAWQPTAALSSRGVSPHRALVGSSASAWVSTILKSPRRRGDELRDADPHPCWAGCSPVSRRAPGAHAARGRAARAAPLRLAATPRPAWKKSCSRI